MWPRKLSDIADINIYVPPSKKKAEGVQGKPQTTGKRKIQWERPEGTTPAPDKEAPRCEQCGKVMALLALGDQRFWSCLNSRCIYKDRIPKHSHVDVFPICHKCGSAMEYFVTPYNLDTALYCPKCEYRQEF